MRRIFFSLFTLQCALLLANASGEPIARQSASDESSQYVLPDGSRESLVVPRKALEPGAHERFGRTANFYHGQSNASVTFDQHSLLLDGKVCFRSPFCTFPSDWGCVGSAS